MSEYICEHDKRFSGVFHLPQEDGGCVACALERTHRELAQSQARCAEVERDAARYRWLWQQTVDRFLGVEREIYIYGVRSSRDGINAAIDALKEPR